MKDTQIILSVVDLKKYYALQKNAFFGKRQYLRANDGVSFQIRRGETFALVGESGCGKSTLGKTILQLERPTDGSVFYYGENGNAVDLAKLDEKQLRPMRRELQIIFQDPYSSLNPRMTVGQIVGEGALVHGYYRKGTAALQAFVLDIMQKCGLPPHTLNRYPHEFSGGQRQRVCIARALALRPKFVVCDECVSALDVSVQSQILNLLAELKEREKLTYLFISHDLSVVRRISDRLAVMYLGEIAETGDSERVFKNPRHPYTIALMSAIPTLPSKKGVFKPRKQILLQGHMPSPVNPPSGCRFHTRCFMAQDICRRIPAPHVEVEKGHFVACHFADIPTAKKRELAFTKKE